MAKPYNPLTGKLPSRKVIAMRARRRARRDTAAKAALLPSDAVVKASGESLIASLRGTTDAFGKVVSNAGASYADATAGAKQQQSAAMSQLGVVEGTAAPPDTRGGLLGAMAANTMGGMSGSVIGAQQGLAGKINANAGKRAAVLAGEDALYEQYLQAGYDDALRTAAAQQNAALSEATLGANMADDAADNAATNRRNDIAQQNADTARERLNATLRNTDNPELQKAIRAAATQMNKTLSGSAKGKRTTGAVYHFEIPALVPGGAPLKMPITARNGNEAKALFAKRAKEMKAAGGLSNYIYDPTKPPQTYWPGKMDKITEEYAIKGSRTTALHEAVRILEAAGMSRDLALQFARKLLGPRPGARKKKKKSTSTATSSQSR